MGLVKSPAGQELIGCNEAITDSRKLSTFFPVSPTGWLSIITGVAGIGSPGYVSTTLIIPREDGDEFRSCNVVGKYGGGGSAIDPTSGSGFAIIEYCQLTN
jgi:hypothetical protein